MSLENKQFDLEAFKGENTIEIEVTLNEENVSAGKVFLGTVTFDFSKEKYCATFAENIDSEFKILFIKFIKECIVKDVMLFGVYEEFGNIQPDCENNIKELLKQREVELISQKEKKILRDFNEDIKKYHLCQKSENEMFCY